MYQISAAVNSWSGCRFTGPVETTHSAPLPGVNHPMDTSTIDQWLQRVASALGQSGMSEDVRRNMRAMTQAWLRDLDIVSREEFEAQRAVLARSRARLEQLERQIAELEQGAELD